MGKSKGKTVPTPITDKNGVQTTRNKSAFEKPAQVRPLPLPLAPAAPDTSAPGKGSVVYMDEVGTVPPRRMPEGYTPVDPSDAVRNILTSRELFGGDSFSDTPPTTLTTKSPITIEYIRHLSPDNNFSFSSDIEAHDAAYAIPADSPILKSRLEYMREAFEPDEDDEDVNPEQIEAEALAHARTTLWIDYLDTFENKMGTHGLAATYSKDVAAFIIINQNVEFNINHSLNDAVDEYLGLV